MNEPKLAAFDAHFHDDPVGLEDMLAEDLSSDDSYLDPRPGGDGSAKRARCASMLDLAPVANRELHSFENRCRERASLVFLEHLMEVMQEVVGKDPEVRGRLRILNVFVKQGDPVKRSRTVSCALRCFLRAIDPAVRPDEEERLHQECRKGVPIGISIVRTGELRY